MAEWLLVLYTIGTANAHRAGCHRWHSCPSDSGSPGKQESLDETVKLSDVLIR